MYTLHLSKYVAVLNVYTSATLAIKYVRIIYTCIYPGVVCLLCLFSKYVAHFCYNTSFFVWFRSSEGDRCDRRASTGRHHHEDERVDRILSVPHEKEDTQRHQSGVF